MAKSKDKKKRLSSEQLHEMGAVNFTMDDVRNVQNQKDSVNAKAYDYMVEAMSVSANYMGDTISEEGVRMDDVYPTTLEETLKMDELLDKSERAVKDDNDEEYNKMIVELRGIVGWSRRRHFNFSWGIIFGTIITVAAVIWLSNSNADEKQRRKAELAAVEAWTVEEGDTTVAFSPKTDVKYGTEFLDAKHYKAYQLANAAKYHFSYLKDAEQYQQHADTAQLKDRKKYYLEQKKRCEKRSEKYQKDYEEASKWTLEDAKKAAVKEKKASARSASRSAAFAYCLMVFFILLIPVYIFANHSWGYVITRTREEAALLEKIKQWGFGIAAGLFGAAAAMEATQQYRVHWSDGSKTTETEVNWFVVAIKVALLIAALVIVAVVSTGIMIYSTIAGLKRNYDWKAIFAEMKAKSLAAKEKAQALSKKA